jgi:hypothetical protein
MIYTITIAGSTDTITTSDLVEAQELADYYAGKGRAFTLTATEGNAAPETVADRFTELDKRITDLECNPAVIDGNSREYGRR